MDYIIALWKVFAILIGFFGLMYAIDWFLEKYL